MGKSTENLVWIDLEMTGVNPDVDRVLEIATIVTDSNLVILGEGPVLAVKQSDSLLANMDDWNTEHHTDSGLIASVRSDGVTELEAEQATIEFLSNYVDAGISPLCGNSIAQDRRFLVRYMPALEAYLHYRNLDVSTVKELAVRWRPDIATGVKKKGKHRALDDIRDSIEELEYYRQHFFNSGESR